jgi:hypothetical protein
MVLDFEQVKQEEAHESQKFGSFPLIMVPSAHLLVHTFFEVSNLSIANMSVLHFVHLSEDKLHSEHIVSHFTQVPFTVAVNSAGHILEHVPLSLT